MKESTKQKLVKSIVLILITWVALLLTYLTMRNLNNLKNTIIGDVYEVVGLLVLLFWGFIIFVALKRLKLYFNKNVK